MTTPQQIFALFVAAFPGTVAQECVKQYIKLDRDPRKIDGHRENGLWQTRCSLEKKGLLERVVKWGHTNFELTDEGRAAVAGLKENNWSLDTALAAATLARRGTAWRRP